MQKLVESPLPTTIQRKRLPTYKNEIEPLKPVPLRSAELPIVLNQ